MPPRPRLQPDTGLGPLDWPIGSSSFPPLTIFDRHVVSTGGWPDRPSLGKLNAPSQQIEKIVARQSSLTENRGHSPAWQITDYEGRPYMLRSLKRATRHKATIDRSRVDAMTEAERHAAAMADPDAKADDGIKNGIVR